MEYVIAIIGGGASGLAAAAAAAERARSSGRRARVVVHEASDKAGRSILASGNGRCNFSNACIDADAYHNAAFAGAALAAFEELAVARYADAGAVAAPNGVVRFFQAHGLMWRSEDDGRLYPKANKASSVLEVLAHALAVLSVEVRTGAQVAEVMPPDGSAHRFMLRMADGAIEHADAVVVACGGRVAAQLVGLPLPFTQPVPLLGPLATDTRYVKPLDNIRVRCAATLARAGQPVGEARGELLFRKYGVSGIMAFDLSRLAQPGDELAIDFLPEMADAGSVRQLLHERKRVLERTLGARPTWEDLLRGMLLAPVADAVLARAGLKGGDAAVERHLAPVADLLKAFTLECRGIGDERSCQVRRGGFAVEAVEPAAMQVRGAQHLFLTGEALDVDGPCGGYNLHWAFATGILAGDAAAEAR